MPVHVAKLIDDPRLLLGIAEVDAGVVREASDALSARGAELAQSMGAVSYVIPEEQRRAVRQLLKLGGFSASGRNRPAQELLVRDLQERGEFNHINNVVDVNNVISLTSLLPISIFDVAKLGGRLTVRVGEPGESYVFNQSGHSIDVKKCVICCRGEAPGEPVGSPIKDSMATKVFDDATHFIAVIYGTNVCWPQDEMQRITTGMAELLAVETGGSVVQAVVI